MMPEQEIATKEKQQVQGSEQTRPGRYFLPDVDISEYDDALRCQRRLNPDPPLRGKRRSKTHPPRSFPRPLAGRAVIILSTT
jgi:hypothetical protein